jgi:UDP-N-acetylglucosamine 4-epimerase
MELFGHGARGCQLFSGAQVARVLYAGAAGPVCDFSPLALMTAYDRLREELTAQPRTWLITGVSGFIGSHLLEALLKLGQRVAGLDNFATGSPANLEAVRANVDPLQWERFTFREGSVTDMNACREICRGADYALHQAGFVSVPLSLEDPLACHDINVTGTLNVLLATRDEGVRRVVYASSSAVYGDDARLPKIEEQIGRSLSPYAASKHMAELYAALFHQALGLETVGFRYFNIFGPRQDPAGGYAAVIPRWTMTLLRGEECTIFGDGLVTRDFCPVADVVQANLLAATTENAKVPGEVFNVGLGHGTSLNELYTALAGKVATLRSTVPGPARYGPARAGDILRSAADLSKIRRELQFEPAVNLEAGIHETVCWYAAQAD